MEWSLGRGDLDIYTNEIDPPLGQTLSHNVVSSTSRHEGIRTQNFSGDRH
jgi:hypothetical protein